MKRPTPEQVAAARPNPRPAPGTKAYLEAQLAERDAEITALKARCFDILQGGSGAVSCFDPDEPVGLSDRDVRVRVSDRVTRFGMGGTGMHSQITSRFIDADGPRGGTRDEVWAILRDEDGVEHGVKVTVHTGPTIDQAADKLLRPRTPHMVAFRRR